MHLISGSPEGRTHIHDMVDACAHRGPNENSTYETEGTVLGFNRLEIVGGSRGKQPMTNEDESLVLIANGEIFNYEELKLKLPARHSYRTQSDVEVLLHLYEELGTQFIQEVEGQFSFVIFDKNRGKIIFGRDRWGITPLFYSTPNDCLLLSSSVRSMMNSGLLANVALDALGIAESWALYGPTPPRTCFKNILQLPPGYYAEFDLKSRELTTHSYVAPEYKQPLSQTRTLTSLLEASIQRRLQGNFGPGVYVSGGVDSSIVAAVVNRISPKKPILFSIAFEDPAFDESFFQKMLAQHLDCELYTVQVGIEDIVKNIEKCVGYVESPIIRTAPIPMMLLSAKVRDEGLKYVLCGEGADELFAGYPVFARGKCSVADKWIELAPFLSFFADQSLQDEIEAASADLLSSDNLSNLRKQEIDTKLSRYLLVGQGDRVAMANSVEQRFPFLDSSVAQLAFSMSESELINQGEGKQSLRKAFQDLLPKELINRRKQGYLTPDLAVVKMMQERGNLRQMLSESLCEQVGIFKHAQLKYLMDNLKTENEGRFLLFAYTTHTLFKNFIEASVEQ